MQVDLYNGCRTVAAVVVRYCTLLTCIITETNQASWQKQTNQVLFYPNLYILQLHYYAAVLQISPSCLFVIFIQEVLSRKIYTSIAQNLLLQQGTIGATHLNGNIIAIQ